MTCLYKINLKGLEDDGLTIKTDLDLGKSLTETDLDQFIYNNNFEKYENYGDLVFSLTTVAIDNIERVKKGRRDFQKLLSEGKVRQYISETEMDGEYYEYEKPLIGTNRWLAQLKDPSDNSPLFPIFIADNLWKKKFLDWNKGVFKDDAEKTEVEQLLGHEVSQITNQDELDFLRKSYTEKWKAQSKVGNTTHKILSLFFTKVKGKENFKLTNEELLEKVKESIPENSDLFQKLTDEQIIETLQYARNLLGDLRIRFGQNAQFFPEIALSTEISETDEGEKSLEGVIDLLVISESGDPQIVDFKTSPKPFAEYDDAKKRAFKYQLATYRRMLQRLNIACTSKAGLYIAPIKYDEFRKEGDNWVYSSITPYKMSYGAEDEFGRSGVTYMEDMTSEILYGEGSNSLNYHLDRELPILSNTEITPQETLTYTKEWMDKCFTGYGSKDFASEEYVLKYIKRRGYDKKVNGKYRYTRTYPTKEQLTFDNVEEMIPEIQKDLKGLNGARQKRTQGIKHDIISAQEHGDTNVIFQGSGPIPSEAKDVNWLTHQLERYLVRDEDDNPVWEVIGDKNYDQLEELGIILMKNKFTKQIDVVKVTTDDIFRPHYMNGRKNITGRFESDIIENNKTNSLILESIQGNIELMEAMFALNTLPALFDGNKHILGSVMVINTHDHNGITASNKELLYNFKALAKHVKLPENNFTFANELGEHRIKMASTVEIVRDHLAEIITKGQNTAWREGKNWQYFQKCSTQLSTNIDNLENVREVLLNMNDLLEKHFQRNNVNKNAYSAKDEPAIKLQDEIFKAISEIDGYDQRQQIHENKQFWQGLKALLHGHSGTMLDNQGFLQDPALNRLAKATTIAYQNTRDRVQKMKSELKDLIDQIKKDEQRSWLYDKTIGNQSDIFKDMTRIDETGDLVFANPNDFNGPKKKLLEYVIRHVNINRYISPEHLNDEAYINAELERKLNENPEAYYRVPLMRASASSKAANSGGGLSGMFKSLKDWLKSWDPDNIKEWYSEKKDQFVDYVDKSLDPNNEVSQSEKINSGSLWKMTNMFDRGEQVGCRFKDLAVENPMAKFETNLETLMLSHEFAYAQKRNLDEIFPMIRATMMNVVSNELVQNRKYTDTINYMEDYIKNKIFNRSLISEEAKAAKIIAGRLQSGASKFALAFSPAQLYQHLDGLWKDISLLIRKPDGDTSFTLENMKDAYGYVYKDLIHIDKNGNSLTEMLNEYYGINDMDMNSYIDKIKSDQGGIFNLDTMMFRMASRPDFYNRMTIFTAQMRGDGCWEAHKKVGNKLVYDWTLDKRFDLFAKYKNNPPATLSDAERAKYNEQKALYISMARQLEREHTKDLNGNDFVLNLNNPVALPKAYTTEQSEGMKALGDMIYGYYSHEKKSLWQSTFLGGLVMQMNTYWSSKKNQFMAPGGIKYMGRMEQYTEPDPEDSNNIIKYWQIVDENGRTQEIYSDKDLEANPDLKEKVIPFTQWKGQFQEGIFVTIFNMAASAWNAEHGQKWDAAWNKYWNNPDENLRRAYRSNIMQLGYDLMGWLLIGMLLGPYLTGLAKDMAKENENDTINDALINTTAGLGASLVFSSGNDFNMFKSIFGIGLSWTPFSVQTYTRMISNVGAVLGGDKRFYDAFVNTFAATRSTKPLWDYINPKEDEEE